jgi:hypoxia up-regulated 1
LFRTKLIISIRALERPIVHRYKEIEEFPQALNSSQMWNWSTRLFLTEAKQNYTKEEEVGGPFKYTQDELGALEKKLIEHEIWLNRGVEKQKKVQFNDDPAIETSEMKKRAEELSKELQKLVRRKTPKVKRSTSKSSTSTSTTASDAQATSPDLSSDATSATTTPLPAETSHPHEEL